MLLTTLIGVLAAGVVLLAVIAARQRSIARRSERRLDDALGRLEQLQTSFGLFAPSTVVDDIVAHGVGTRAEKREVTVLFADLQGFTAMSSGLDPEELVEILNGYFEAMSVAIHAHNGHVSKFIGDGILALFGAVQLNPWQAKDGVDAALEMRRALHAYNERLAARDRPILSIGIGLHRGEVVAGIVGSAHLMEYTVIGDVVNVASRVEGLTRTHGVDILITEPIRAAIDSTYRLDEKPPAAIKGKTEPIATWAVAGRDLSDP